jgi:hypothetical protein|tara:strand:+ start:671 stop:1177 length:507 start_codon:yes stop_codon:yes gene_type:complete
MASVIKVDTIQNAAGTFEHARLVQVVNVADGAVATGTTVMPADNTIPQITEGDQYMSLAITPTHADNKLFIQVEWCGSSSTANEIWGALFQDSTANALAASGTQDANNSQMQILSFSHYMDAGTTSATTFRVRVGAGAASTITFNGTAGAARLGGVMASSITISEIRE